MEAVRALMRFFSYLYHGLLLFFLLAVSGLALAAGVQDLSLGMLPWTGSTLIYVVFFGGVFGLLTLVLALRGSLRILFFLWSIAVALMLIKGYVFSGYHFDHNVGTAGSILVGSIIAALGAWFVYRQPAPVLKKKF